MQDIGDVITKTHRCVAFPNLYQHQVQPFRLEDPTKPGHRRILVFFLVDPMQKILSATDVGPQQRGWINKTVHGTGQNSAFAEPSAEPLMVPAYLSFTCTGPHPLAVPVQKAMTRSEAEKYREELMSERVISVKGNDKAHSVREADRAYSVKENDKTDSVKEDDKAHSMKEDDKARSVKEADKAHSVKENNKAHSVKENKTHSVKKNDKARRATVIPVNFMSLRVD